jgi:outer membrane protein assembly factor BamD
MQKINRLLGILAILSFLSFSCSKFQRIQKSDKTEDKYKAAVEYYQDKEYYKADLLFEDIIPLLKGSKESEMAQFYQAYCKYRLGDYILSEYLFKKFYETFSRSTYAEEAMYMRAMSLYEDSPVYNLDQTNTYTAITAMQTFINAYPESKYSEKCTKTIGELRNKLEKKAFGQAILYAKIGEYKAAVIAFNNFQRHFPDSDYNEEVAFLKVQSAYNLAKQSTEKKQKERYHEAISFYEGFIDKYPQSRYIRNAENIYENCLEAVKSNNTNLQSNRGSN